MKTKKSRQVTYLYKDGRFLKTSYIGDGDYELILTTKLTKDCFFHIDWLLSNIIQCCDGIYNDSGDLIKDTISESDFLLKEENL